jgi:glutamate-1-semialdehyde 2,1-aminomutase
MCASSVVNAGLESAVRDAELAYAAANSKSRAYYEFACAVLPGGNIRSHLYFAPFPLTLETGRGCYVWDADGHRYIDFLGEYTAGFFGHSDPVIAAALREGVDAGLAMGGPGSTDALFAKLLCDRFPSIERVRFCNSGTEANLFALAAARMYTGREKILAFRGAYHGSCFRFAKGGSPLNVPLPFVLAGFNDTVSALTLIDEHADQLAAVIVEPVQGAGGYIAADRDFLLALRRATEARGIVLIFDEVVTSRMSLGGMQALLDITPDMTTLGKYMGGGCSFGAFGGKASIMRRFDPRERDAVYHAGTFNNNRLTMAAGYAAMSKVFTAPAVDSLRNRGDTLRRRLEHTVKQHALPMQITGFGSVMNIHFSAHPVRSYDDVPAGADLQKRLWHFDMLARGLYCPTRGAILLSLPMGDQETDALASAFETFVAQRASLLASS